MAEEKVLIICDEQQLTEYLSGRLQEEGGYSVSIQDSSIKGLVDFKEGHFSVVIAKLEAADTGRLELLKEIKKEDPSCVVITYLQEYTTEDLNNLLRLGIYDYTSLPINYTKLIFTIRKGLELRTLLLGNERIRQGLTERVAALEKQNLILAKRLEDSSSKLSRLYEDLRSTYLRTIKVLAQTIDARDHYTHSHSLNVSRYAELIAREMGLPFKEVESIREACELHDLGKIGIADSILSKDTTLTEAEWDKIKQHPVTGAKILEPLTFLNEVVELVRQHHEHYDGSGYPEGRQQEDVLLGARIIHLADAFDSMCSARSYRKTPLTKEEAILEIRQNSGSQFDPKVVEAFLRIVDSL
jgi:putative nucleotidyltransferase with HDIG domain